MGGCGLRIGITGAFGMIGWHLRCSLLGRKDCEAMPAGRKVFASAGTMAEFVSGCDAIVHLAGQNRGDDKEVYATNTGLARAMVSACRATGSHPHVVFANSTHVDRDTRYGDSKRDAAAIFREWSESDGGHFTDLVLPHVFGEHGRPFYNSVVHTFCYQIAGGDAPTIDHDGDLELLHAASVSDLVHEVLADSDDGPPTRQLRPPGVQMKVSSLLERLQGFAAVYREQQLIPDLRESIDLALFNTLRASLYPGHYPVELMLHRDDRGSLFEAVKTWNGGQTFLSTTRPGITRGNHFHFRKVERFLVVRGEAVIRIRRLFDDTVREFPVSGERPAYVDIPTLHTHNITNTGGGELLTLFWANEIFDRRVPDTVGEDVG